METPYNFPQDDYALTILTHAAMSNSGYEQRPTSRNPRTDVQGSSTTSITNQHIDQDQNINQRPSNGTPDILNDYNPGVLSSRSMETLTFNPAHAGRPNPYMTQAYQGIGSRISANYANSLGILNAESYDDRRGAIEANEMRMKQQADTTMPFGITGGPRIRMDLELRTDSEEHDAGTRRRKKPRIDAQSVEDEEEARKKARGRPRVDTKDETAADRRRTQIRMAQRAYRHRKETTISSLEKQVQELRGTNEEMSNIFISLYDFAIGKGLLQREPEFGQQLQSTTERFLALAKASTSEDLSHEENAVESGKHDRAEEPEPGRRSKRRGSPKKVQEETPPVSEPANTWGGYTLSKEDSPIEEIEMGYQQQSYDNNPHQRDLQVITRPTEDNASFPFDLMDLQSYRVEVPSIEDFSQNFYPQSQPPLPTTHNYNEFSFARRIQRGAIERAFRLITMKDPPAKRFQEVFGFCLLYESKEAIEGRLKKFLDSSTKETLQHWRAPFVHLGGSGTFYPMHDGNVDGDLIPKFRTGYSMGPFSPSVTQAQEVMEDDMRCNLPGFEGEFFDPNDVEGYLRGRGLDISPAADFVTGEVDLLALSEVPSPKSNSSDSVASMPSPQTPRSPIGSILVDAETAAFNAELARSDLNMRSIKNLSPTTLPFPLGYTNWDNDSSSKDGNNFIDPIFSTMPGQNLERSTPHITISGGRLGDRQTVTISVQTLLDEILRRAVCLGRAPGFRPADVNAAIIAAVKAGFGP